MPFTVLLVDDEPLAREGLRVLLEQDSEVASIQEARDGREALAMIRSMRPDLVFLDVQMPEMDGFSVVRQLEATDWKGIVFVTAHDRYAIDAFELNAIDYLLKPVTQARFLQTLTRAKAQLQLRDEQHASRRILSMLEGIASPGRFPKRLAVRSAGKTIFVEVQDLRWVAAAENYVELHVERQSHLLHVTMNTLEKALDPGMFLRIHRSIIVNIGYIKELQPALHGEYLLTLHDGVRLQSGRAYCEKVRALTANRF